MFTELTVLVILGLAFAKKPVRSETVSIQWLTQHTLSLVSLWVHKKSTGEFSSAFRHRVIFLFQKRHVIILSGLRLWISSSRMNSLALWLDCGTGTLKPPMQKIDNTKTALTLGGFFNYFLNFALTISRARFASSVFAHFTYCFDPCTGPLFGLFFSSFSSDQLKSSSPSDGSYVPIK